MAWIGWRKWQKFERRLLSLAGRLRDLTLSANCIFAHEVWHEIRIDVEPQSEPDLVASITELRSSVAMQSFDAIWSSHTLEHLYAHEAPTALAEFGPALKPDSFALVTSPDM